MAEQNDRLTLMKERTKHQFEEEYLSTNILLDVYIKKSLKIFAEEQEAMTIRIQSLQ